MEFSTRYSDILEKIEQINPVAYGKTRNYTDGAVTRLSPYISRGVISLPQIRDSVLSKYSFQQSEKLLQELAWREYWQRVWQLQGTTIFTDLRQSQNPVITRQLPAALTTASTGIEAVDEGIRQLYQTGYMHNHCRMYVASLACNIAKAHWLQPSRWLYYHLLDGDLASNALSWQWVAGSFSSKKYFCNQENINKYFHTRQRNSYLDTSYEALVNMEIPAALQETIPFHYTTVLPVTNPPVIQPNLPSLIYNAYNLDPLWHAGEPANRILLLEPSHYRQYPVSEKLIDFVLALASNIPGIQVYAGEWTDLLSFTGAGTCIFRSHPAFDYYTGVAEPYPYLFPQVKDPGNSFFSFWKKCMKYQ